MTVIAYMGYLKEEYGYKKILIFVTKGELYKVCSWVLQKECWDLVSSHGEETLSSVSLNNW